MKLVVIGGDLDPPDNTSWHPPFEDPMMISTFSPTVISLINRLFFKWFSRLGSEVLGIRWGLQTAKNANWQTVTIVSDAEVVVKCINSKAHVAAIDHIVQDCKDLLLAFQVSNVVFVKRDLNVVAHSLVNLSKTVGCRTWSGYVPTQANSAVVPVSVL
ncbi:unnamed protein product [Trifolium pratense]|uniref:Uncharacterized protein n=1 Tax=Trifolium pratense TaxID=57577 RepID=A0ACB0KLX4_TRIPR|nr:unnamed protein product [Trifolium pratense]